MELGECPAEDQQLLSDEEWNVYLLIHDDTDSIVQQALAEDDSIQLGVDLILIEYGKNGDWIRSG